VSIAELLCCKVPTQCQWKCGTRNKRHIHNLQSLASRITYFKQFLQRKRSVNAAICVILFSIL